MKVCKKCGNLFTSKSCSPCNVRRVKLWVANNREKHRAFCRKWSKNNRPKINAIQRAWRKLHPDKRTEYFRTWASKNRVQRRQYAKRRLASNPQAAMAKTIRGRLTKVLLRYSLSKKDIGLKTEELLGCTWKQIVEHIESQFVEGMGWHNRSLWHVDHKKPICSFDLTNTEELKAAASYLNLQPLWSQDNRKKGGRVCP